MEQKEVDKIEVGEWIRTHTGEIGKVFKVELAKEEREKYPNNPYKGYWRDKYVTDVRKGYCTRQVIKKHSKRLIELIEKEDYVNGHKVYEVTIGALASFITFEPVGYHVDSNEIINEKDIKTIVTKEQYKNLEYKVEV